MDDPPTTTASPLRVGSLFSGYGGLDLAVEHAFNAETIWFSEINARVARVFAHHWPHAPNLGDITRVTWSQVEPVDILTGGFPCQDVSTVGKRVGLAPGTRSGLWAHMATAIEALQPQWVVIENVRGLLSSPAIRSTDKGDVCAPRNSVHATPGDAALRSMEPHLWGLGDRATRSLRAAGAVLGDLADLRYDVRWIGLPASTVGAPHTRFRIFMLARPAVPNTASLGLVPGQGNPRSSPDKEGNDCVVPSDHRPGPARTRWLLDQQQRLGSAVQPDREHVRWWGGYAHAIARWEHITGRSAPAPALLDDHEGPRPAPAFVEWLMGLPCGWVTDPGRALSGSQQNAALGNGVLPLQIIERARKTGHLREDFASQDLILVLMANAGVVAATGASAPESWRRLVGHLLRGFANPGAPLPAIASVPDDEQLYRAMARVEVSGSYLAKRPPSTCPADDAGLAPSSPSIAICVAARACPGLRRRTADACGHFL